MPIPETDPLVVAPTPTPFRADGAVDYDAMSRNVGRWLETPLSGFVLGSGNGEELALSEGEKTEIIRTVSAARDGRLMVIAGIDVPSSDETLRLADKYASAGADIVRVRIPRSLPPHRVADYFDVVADGSPVPVIVIHQMFEPRPGAPPEVIGQACSHANVFGYITDHDVRFEGWVRPHVPEDRRFWICNGGLLAYGMLLGANGACMWLGNIAPALCMGIIAVGHAGDFARARELQTTASMLDRRIGAYGVGGVKAALAELGYAMSGPRAPRPDLSDDERADVRRALQDAGLLG